MLPFAESVRGWLSACAVALLLDPVPAQSAPASAHLERVFVHSGVVDNPTPLAGVVWRDFVILPPGTPWLRLHYDAVSLGKGSHLRITSLLDGDFMTQHGIHVQQWSHTSCYFNGNAVMVELIAGPDTTGNSVAITEVEAGDIDPSTPESICGIEDDRSPSSDVRSGRVWPIGNSAFLIDAPGDVVDKCHLSVGHAFSTGQVLEFAVPASLANCSVVHPPAAKQFAVDSAGSQWAFTGPGVDYWVFKCFPNPTTGRTTFEEQGSAYSLATAIPPIGASLRHYGYGIDGTNTTPGSAGSSCTCSAPAGTGTRNLTQQLSVGALASVVGTELRHQCDTCAGSTGGVVLDVATGLAVGIHTTGGCTTSPATSNIAMSVMQAGLQAAIVAVCGAGSPPANDDCSGARPVALGTNGPFTNVDAGFAGAAFPCGFGVGNDVWFRITTCAGSHTFSTCTPTRDFDTVIELFGGSCASLTSLGCNDDACSLGSSLTRTLAAGTYYVRVGGYNGAQGNFDLVVAGPSDRIHDGGPIVTDPTGGFGGAPLSALANPPLGIFGYAASDPTFSLSDDFATNGTWCVNAVRLWTYQTGVVAPSITGVHLAFYSGDPATGGALVAGSPSFATNLAATVGYVVTNEMTGIYRATQSSPLGTTRQVQSVSVSLPTALNLNGRYWIRMAFTGSGTSGPWVPPITVRGSPATGSGAAQSNGGVWSPLVDGTFPQGLPFALYGTKGSADGAFTDLGGGCSPATLDVRGAPHVGGIVHAEIVNPDPAAIPLIILGFSDPNSSFAPFCGCVSHASLDILSVGATYNWQVPMIPSAVGFQFYLQGDQVFAPGLACDIGIGFRFELTNGVRVRFE